MTWFAQVPAAADEAPEVVVVTASHFERPSAGPAVDATVLTPVDAPEGATLADLLASVSDVEVQRPGGAAGTSSIFLRGAKPNFTLVMIEGVPLNDQTNSRGGSVDVSSLNTLDLDRVEIVRGPLSSIYGSGAVQGAVNLILPDPSAAATGAIFAAGGTDGDIAGAMMQRGPIAGGVGGVLSADWDDAGHAVEQSSRVNEVVTAKLAPLDGSDRYGLVLRLSRSATDAFPDDSGGPELAVLRDVEHTRNEQALIGAHWTFPLEHDLDLELTGSGTSGDFHDATPGVAPGPGGPEGAPAGTSRDQYTFGRVQAILRFDPRDGWRALAGAELQEEHGRDDSDLTLFGQPFPSHYTLDRATPAIFLEGSGEAGPVSLDASARVDQPGNLGNHVTGQFGLGLPLSASLTVHAMWGDSFKAPSFYALGNAFIGNRALKPESASTAELGAKWSSDAGFSIEANLFRTQYHQLVDFDPGPPPQLVNRDSVLSQGIEATLAAQFAGRGTFSVSATYVGTRNQADNTRLLELPPWRVTSALEWRFSDRLRARLDAIYDGDRLDTSVPTGEMTLPAYTALTARLFYDVGPDTELEADLENALDTHYEGAIGFPAPGIVGRLGIIHRF
jgi:outer membrane cobalamin receptor